MALICGTTPEARGVAQEDIGIAAQAHHPFLDTGAPGIIDADHRRAVFHRHIHDLADLLGMDLTQAAAKDGEILGKYIDQTGRQWCPSP